MFDNRLASQRSRVRRHERHSAFRNALGSRESRPGGRGGEKKKTIRRFADVSVRRTRATIRRLRTLSFGTERNRAYARSSVGDDSGQSRLTATLSVGEPSDLHCEQGRGAETEQETLFREHYDNEQHGSLCMVSRLACKALAQPPKPNPFGTDLITADISFGRVLLALGLADSWFSRCEGEF